MYAEDVTARWRLASFNLESLDEHASAPDAFAARAAILRPRLCALDADILCLQEVNAQGHGRRAPRRFDALEHLLAGTPYAHFEAAYSTQPHTHRPADVHNLVILSRWPILTQRQLWHDFVPVWRMPAAGQDAQRSEHEIGFDRPVLIATIAAPCGPLHVFNLHLRAPRSAPFQDRGRGGRWNTNAAWAEGLHIAALKRQGQALEVRLAADAIFDENPAAMIAIAGDLNADSFETPVRILRGVPDEGGQPPLDARELAALDQRIPQAGRYSVIHDNRRVMLDHILCSPALLRLARGIAVFNDDLADEAHVDGPVAGSLHAPVVAEFGGDTGA